MKNEKAAEWLRPASLVLVFIGGVCGAAMRETLMLLFPQTGPTPLTLLAINLIGAFLLGVLLEALIRSTGRRAGRARLLLGTGVLGGFTSYSALALAVAALLAEAQPWLAVAYGLGTIVVGALFTLLGIAVGRLLRGPARGGPHGDAPHAGGPGPRARGADV